MIFSNIKLYIYGAIGAIVVAAGLYVYSLKAEIKNNEVIIHNLKKKSLADDKSAIATDLSHELEVSVAKVKGTKYEFESNRSIGPHTVSFKRVQ